MRNTAMNPESPVVEKQSLQSAGLRHICLPVQQSFGVQNVVLEGQLCSYTARPSVLGYELRHFRSDYHNQENRQMLLTNPVGAMNKLHTMKTSCKLIFPKILPHFMLHFFQLLFFSLTFSLVLAVLRDFAFDAFYLFIFKDKHMGSLDEAKMRHSIFHK